MMWRGLFPAALLLAGLALPQSSIGQAAAADSIIEQIRIECTPAWYARPLIGKHACIAGKVYGISSNRHGDTQLSLCPKDRECAFRAVVSKRDRDAIGDLSYLHGRLIVIMGDVVNVHNAPRIFITEKEQIKVAPGNPPIEFDASHHRPRGKVHHEQIPSDRPW